MNILRIQVLKMNMLFQLCNTAMMQYLSVGDDTHISV